jgi:hypothetical protein
MPPKTAKTTTTRKRKSSITTLEEDQDIQNVKDGRKYLEKHSLLCPPGEPASNGALAVCLHQISAMSGMPKQVINAIRATAFLLEEVEEEATNEIVRKAFDSQITEFTSDMKLLVEDVNTKIDTHLKEATTRWNETIKAMAPPLPPTPPTVTSTKRHNQNQNQNQNPPAQATESYATELISPPSNVNPRLAAREGIRARQFLLELKDEDEDSENPEAEPRAINATAHLMKEDLNKALTVIGVEGGKVRSAIPQRNGNGILIEVDSDTLAKWFTDVVNRVELCSVLGEGFTFRPRLYNVMAFNAPLNLNPENPKDREEISETNEMGVNAILALRWAKPIGRRSLHQKTAHIVISFTDPKVANRAISNGITICNRKCQVEKVQKEPLRCHRCQG